MIQRIKDLIREMRINYHVRQVRIAYKKKRGVEDAYHYAHRHYLQVRRHVSKRSPGQVERMERARGLR